MPTKNKLGILDLETLDDTLTKSAEVGMLQWILKLMNASHLKKVTSGLSNIDKKESERQEKELYDQYQAFGSAVRLNEEFDYTPDDVEKVMQHFILAYEKTLMAQGIKSLDRGTYEIDDEVAYFIKASFERYLVSSKKKGDLAKAFRSIKRGGVKPPFPSARQGGVPDFIKEMTEIIMQPPYPTLESALEIVSHGIPSEKSNLKIWVQLVYDMCIRYYFLVSIYFAPKCTNLLLRPILL